MPRTCRCPCAQLAQQSQPLTVLLVSTRWAYLLLVGSTVLTIVCTLVLHQALPVVMWVVLTARVVALHRATSRATSRQRNG